MANGVCVVGQTKERAKELFRELIYDDLNVDVIHADRTHAQREKVVDKFRTGKVCWAFSMCVCVGCALWVHGPSEINNSAQLHCHPETSATQD